MRLRILAIALLAALTVGCGVSIQSSIATGLTQATAASEQLHCGATGAPAQPLCLNDRQFQQVNADLEKISQAQLDYINIVQAAQLAKTQPPITATVAFIGVLSQAMTDIAQITGASTATILGDLKAIAAKL